MAMAMAMLMAMAIQVDTKIDRGLYTSSYGWYVRVTGLCMRMVGSIDTCIADQINPCEILRLDDQAYVHSNDYSRVHQNSGHIWG